MDIHAIDVLVPAPDDGKPGNDAVNYVIVCSNSSPNVSEGDVTVSLTAYKIEGSKRTTADMTKFVFYVDGERGANTSNPLRVTIRKGNTTPKLVYLRDLSLANTYAECAINPVVNGENSIRVDLDNEMDSVPCDSSGTVTSDTTITTKATVYDGAKPVATGVSGPGTGSLSLAGTKNGTGINNGVVTVSWYIPKDTVLTSIRYTVTIPITYNNVTYNALFTLNAVRSGKSGISPIIIQVKPSLTSINFKRVSDTSNTLTPTSVTISCGYTKNVDGKVTVINNCDGRVDSNHYIYYRFDNDSLIALTSQAGVSVPNSTDKTSIEFCISTEGTTSKVSDSNIIDRETVPIVKSGSNGSDGKTVTAQYSINGVDNWHPKFATGDIWMRTSDDGGKTWGAAMRVVGERGNDGAWTDYSFNISSALTSANVNTAPTPLGRNNWQDAPVQTNSAYPYLWMRVQNYSDKTTKDGNASYIRVTGEKGPQGITGGVGPMMYYAGEWQTGVSYVRTSRVVPLVSHGNDEFFYYPAKEGTLTDNEPSSTNKSWEQQQMVPLLLAKLAMVNFGKIASAIFSGDFMFSQYGTHNGIGVNGSSSSEEKASAYKDFDAADPDNSSKFVPNLYLNFMTGLMRSYKMKAYDMEAHGGKFENISVRGSGTFSGRMNSPWTYAPGRGEIMKSDNIIIDQDYVFAGGLTGTKEDSGRTVRILNLTTGGVIITLNNCKLYTENGKLIENTWIPQGRCITTLLGVGTNEEGFAYWQIIDRTDYLKTIWSHGKNVPVLAYGRVDVNYNTTSKQIEAKIDEQSTFDGSKVKVTREGVGRYRLGLPTNWTLTGRLHVIVTPYQYEFDTISRNKRIVMIGVTSISGYNIYVETADDDSDNDCSFFFEVKNMGELDYYN